MKNQTLILIFVIVTGIITPFTISCKKTFLNQLPETSRATKNAYKTPSDFYNGVIGCYSTLKNPGLYANCSSSSALLNLGEVVSDNSDFGSTRNPSTTSVFELVDFNFSLSNSYFASAWIDHYIGIGRTNTLLERLANSNIDTTLKARFGGEARFLRALFYFDLVRLFGDVPLVTTESLDPNAGNNLSRTPSSQVYSSIINDLITAESGLPLTIPTNENGRASKWAAKALLAKVYLTKKDYVNAAITLNEIISSGQFGLLSSYASVFNNSTPYLTSSKEVLFSVQYMSGQIGQGSSISTSCVPFNVSIGLFGILGGGTGEGFLRPTSDMDQTYETDDLRKSASMKSSYLNGSSVVFERYVTKFIQSGSLVRDADIDFPILRYADVLLMYTEALNEQGQTEAASSFINMVRIRAGLPILNASLSQADMRLNIEKERRVEFAFEGQRWFDLIRTGRYLTVMTSKGYATKPYNNLFPIPQRETDLNSALDQNPGY